MGRWLTPNVLPTVRNCRTLHIPANSDWLAIVSGALLPLTRPWNWEKEGTLTAQECADAMSQMFDEYYASGGCMIGHIFMHCLLANPINSVDCDGATYLRTDYPELYAIIGATFIIDADHFKVPDLRGRSPVGTGAGPGLTARANNVQGGVETVTLTAAQMPAHTHSEGTTALSTAQAPVAPVPTAVGIVGSTGSAGGGGSHENMHPFTTVKICIQMR